MVIKYQISDEKCTSKKSYCPWCWWNTLSHHTHRNWVQKAPILGTNQGLLQSRSNSHWSSLQTMIGLQSLRGSTPIPTDHNRMLSIALQISETTPCVLLKRPYLVNWRRRVTSKQQSRRIQPPYLPGDNVLSLLPRLSEPWCSGLTICWPIVALWMAHFSLQNARFSRRNLTFLPRNT